MKNWTTRWLSVSAGAALGMVPWSVGGQAFLLADIKTVNQRNSGANDSALAPRLWVDEGGTPERAPLGTSLWFVADLNGDGLRVQNLGRGAVLPNELFGIDDIVLLRDTVDGDQPGAQPGVYRRVGVPIALPLGRIPEEIFQGNIYALLWNSSAVGTEPLAGGRFGILNLGINAKPALGNPFWAIDQNVVANQFGVVPEPGATVGIGGLLLAGWGWWRHARRTDKR